MTCELYINGILCDLPDDEAVTLLYQSPIFSGLDIIQSNRSYNIALPPTPTNIGAVRFAERPDADSDVPYIRNTAALYQDGVPLFTQGFAVVTDISDTINVTLTWGNADNFQPLFDSNLRDLGPQLEAAGAGHIAWNADTKILEANTANKYPGVAFWGIDFGMGLNDPKYLHPSVQVETLLSAIEQYNGITIDGKERLAYSKNLGPIVPLVSRNGSEESGKAEIVICASDITAYNKSFYITNKGSYSLISPRYVNRPDLYNSDGSYNSEGITTHIQTTSIWFNGDLAPGDRYNLDQIELRIVDASDIDRILYSAKPVSASLVNGFRYAPIDVEVDTADINQISLIITRGFSNASESANGKIQLYTYPRDEVHFPSIFPVAANLPDMSQGDFLLALMTMNGLFAYADKDSPNTIKLISIDDIFARIDKGEILDWSDRVLLNDIRRVDMPDASVFSIDGLAQRNILDYDNDDDVRTDTYGMITVRNENIEKKTELASLPFSASENTSSGGVSCARIPIYENDSRGGAKYSEVTPRILSSRKASISGVARCLGQFDPWMKFGGEEGIVKTRYASYQKVVDQPRMITVRAALTPLDLYNLDYARPVYIAQFGQIFAVYSVETGEDDICECRLLKLNAEGHEVQYYLKLNGHEGQIINIQLTSEASLMQIPYETNGTLKVLRAPGNNIVRSVNISDTHINIYTNANTGGSRFTFFIVALEENLGVARTIMLEQKQPLA